MVTVWLLASVALIMEQIKGDNLFLKMEPEMFHGRRKKSLNHRAYRIYDRGCRS